MFRERARAKVNLTLRVLGRRPDNYHEIDSLISFAENAFDVVTLDPGKSPVITTSGPFANAIQGTNIVASAFQQLEEVAPQLRLGAVHIDKRLPVAAGIGGGSADAGALLRAVAAANPDIAGDIDWMAIAARLGADVPVCFANVSCRVTGIGERLEFLPQLAPLNAVLVNSLDTVPANKTAQIFGLLSAGSLSATDPSRAIPPPANLQELTTVMSEIGNDLEPTALNTFPPIANVLDALRATEGCQYAAMSGAGPTCFGLFDNSENTAATLAQVHPNWWIKATQL